MCKPCSVNKEKMRTQFMAGLATKRCSFALPFTITGIDFAGALRIASMLKSFTFRKGYVAVFVCFTTKAVDLGLCSDLTTATFLAAHFAGRRGFPSKIISETGKDFVETWKDSANQQLKALNSILGKRLVIINLILQL